MITKFKLSLRVKVMSNARPVNPTDTRILLAAKMFNIHPRDLVGPYKFGFLMLPRYALTKALRMRGLSTPKIGKIVNRDHSSVLHHIKQADYFMQRDTEYKKNVNKLYLRLAELQVETDDFYE